MFIAHQPVCIRFRSNQGRNSRRWPNPRRWPHTAWMPVLHFTATGKPFAASAPAELRSCPNPALTLAPSAQLLSDEPGVPRRSEIKAVDNSAQRAQELAIPESLLSGYTRRYESNKSRPSACKTPDCLHLGRIAGAIQGPEIPKLAIRRTNHRVCLHAGNGADRRSCRGLGDRSEA